MFFYAMAGVVSAFAIIFLLAKFDFGKVLWLDIPIDIASTALLIAMFAGTFAGMMAAVIGGCIISAFLWASKRVRGYKKLIWDTYRFRWIDVKPR